MEAVLLAAGRGVRLRPHTLNTPKPLLPVQGRPILDWTLEALPPAVDRVVVVVNYLAGQIQDYLASQRHVRHWATVHQTEPRGTGDAFRSCREQLHSDRYLVLNGDDLYGAADLAALAACDAGIMVHPVEEPRLFGIVFPRPDGTLERLEEKPNLTGQHLANVGAYVFPRSVFDLELKLSPRGEYEITDYVGQLAARQPVRVVTATCWYPIGNVDAWQQAQQTDLSACLRAG